MALTVTKAVSTVTGNRRLVAGTIAFDSSYPTGGERVTPAMFGLNHIDELIVGGVNSAYLVRWNSPYLLAYTALGTQASNNANLSSLTGVPVLAIGY